MSTNKTENYQLHVWELGDDFLLHEINENFAKLDQIPEIITGMYTGDGELARTMELGFRPLAVLVMDRTGATHSSQASYGGLALDGWPVIHGSVTIVEIGDGGFRVARGYKSSSSSSYWADTNKENTIYHYLALKG